jgi:hypothetical protein
MKKTMKHLISLFGLICFWILFVGSGNTCALSGCDREAEGWKHYSTSQGSAFGQEFIGCVRKDTSGGYCTRSHCQQDQ